MSTENGVLLRYAMLCNANDVLISRNQLVHGPRMYAAATK